MSLVGSLEDLSLGDILQIISLSRKSGVLVLRSEQGEAQVIFRDGAIRAAFSKGGPTDLRELLVGAGALEPSALDASCKQARESDASVESVLVERGLLSAEAIDGLRRDNIDRSVLEMFRWATGEFSFEVSEECPHAAEDLFVDPGVNPQFLAMEGVRLQDEGDRDEIETLESEAIEGGDPEIESVHAEIADVADAVDAAFGPDMGLCAKPEPVQADASVVAADVLAEAAVERAASAEAVAVEEAPPAPGPPPPVVVVDPDLRALEWVKQALGERFPRVHIFQRPEQGVGRIRQYLARAEVPLVILAEDTPPDPLSGAADALAIAKRLKVQASRITVVLMAPEGQGAAPPDCIDGRVSKPPVSCLADGRFADKRRALGERIRDELAARFRLPVAEAAPADLPDLAPQIQDRLKQVSATLRDHPDAGEVIPLLLSFAAEFFGRVAIFLIREGRVAGLAQQGLARGGGPGDADFRDIHFALEDSAWFRRVMQAGEAVRAAPSDAGDQRLAVLLGNSAPREAYLAPLCCGAEVVAVLYADNLPADTPAGDSAGLEIVLYEAGLVLDRAALERALHASG